MSDSHSSILSHQFETLDQQRASAEFGMWLFLVTEVLFFGGLFVSYAVYRYLYPVAFAESSQTLDMWLGCFNTFVLLTSSLTMALAVHAAEAGDKRKLIRFLLFTMFLGTVFLVIKGFEYHHKFEHHLVPGAHFEFEGPEKEHAQIFFFLYFVMTGIHGLHMIIGLGVLSVLILMAYNDRFSKEYFNPIHITGLYWHFVDIVWIFLYPFLYLIGHPK